MAEVSVETQPVIKDITLHLSLAEAEVLYDILGTAVIGTMTSRRRATHEVFMALCGVPEFSTRTPVHDFDGEVCFRNINEEES